MKAFIVLALATVALAFPVPESAPFELSHHSDLDGTYSFSFSSEDASRTETRSALGQVTGAYSYLDSEGVLQKLQYVADENGFQVYGTNLPVGSTVPVKETPEVLEATAEHFALIDKHLKKVMAAKLAHEKYLLEHPEAAEEEHHIVEYVPTPVQHFVHHVAHHTEELPIAPMDDEDVQIARAEHLAEVARLTAEHYEALRNAPKFVEGEQHFEHVAPTVEYIPVHHVQHFEEELPVPPMDDEDVKQARAEHLAEVARLTAEHYEALAKAPKVVEEEQHFIHHDAPVVEYIPVQYVHHEEELPVPPMEDDDVKQARAEHLAEVARLTAEHYDALAKAPKYVEEEQKIEYVPVEYVHHYTHHEVEETPVAPDDDDDVKMARAEHLAEVARIKSEHSQLFAEAALRNPELKYA